MSVFKWDRCSLWLWYSTHTDWISGTIAYPFWESPFGFHSLCSWASMPRLPYYHHGLDICHRSHSFAKPVLLHPRLSPRLLKCTCNMFTSLFSLHPPSASSRKYQRGPQENPQCHLPSFKRPVWLLCYKILFLSVTTLWLGVFFNSLVVLGLTSRIS